MKIKIKFCILILVITASSFAIGNTWFQTDWNSSPDTSVSAVDPANQTGWKDFYSKDSTITISDGSFSFANTQSTFTQDDWSGGDGQVLYTDTKKYYQDDGSIDSSTSNKIMLKFRTDWWDYSWERRYPIDIVNNSTEDPIPADMAVSITIDHATMVGAGYSLSDGSDVRIVFWDDVSQSFAEIERFCENSWGKSDTKVWFNIQRSIPASETSSDYYVYFDNLSAPAVASEDPNNIFQFYEDFSGTALDTTVWDSAGTPNVDGGLLTIDDDGDYVSTKSKFVPTTNNGISLLMKMKVYRDNWEKGLWAGFVDPALSTPFVSVKYVDMYTSTDGLGRFMFQHQFAAEPQSLIIDDNYLNDFFLFEIGWTTSKSFIVIDDVENPDANIIQSPIGASIPISFERETNSKTSYNALFIDWTAINLYVNPKPTMTLGAEEGFYHQNGYFESSTIDLGDNCVIESISFTPQTQSDTTVGETPIKIQIATSVDGQSWDFGGPDGTYATFYTTSTGETASLINSNIRYLKYKVFLTTDNTSVSPELNSISIVYRSPFSGELVSSPYYSGIINNSIDKITWVEDKDDYSDVTIQIRTAPDDNGVPGVWSDWVGPNGASSYFTDPSGAELPPLVISDGIDDQWFQYKVVMSSQTNYQPSLSNISIVYPEQDSFPAVEITNVTPNSGSVDGGTQVALIGSGFQSGAVVKIGETEGTTLYVTDESVVFVTPPKNVNDAEFITLILPDGQEQVAPLSFFYEEVGSLTISEPDISIDDTSELNDAQNVPVMICLLSASQTEDVILDDFTVHFFGTVDDVNDFASTGLSLVDDTNKDGVYQSDVDNILATDVVSGDNGSIEYTGLKYTIEKNTDVQLIVVGDLNGTASPGEYFYTEISNNTDVTAVGASTKTSILGAGAPFKGKKITIGSSGSKGAMFLRKYSLQADTTYLNNQTSIPVMAFLLCATSMEDIKISKLIFTSSGSGHDVYDLSNTYLYLDNNYNGVVDSGIDTLVKSGMTYNANDGILVVNGLNITVSAGEAKYFILLYDLSGKADPLDAFYTSLNSATDITALGDTSSEQIYPQGAPVVSDGFYIPGEDRAGRAGPKTCFISQIFR